MIINDRKITERLGEICRQVGGDPKPFIISLPPRRVDKDLETLKAVEAFFDPCGVLIHEGRPAMVYIRDHAFGEYSEDPDKRRKLHFTMCETLEDMREKKRLKPRYRLTNRDDDHYPVDICGGKELDREILYPCRNCLANVHYHEYSPDMDDTERDAIVEGFKAKEAYRLLRRYFDIFQRHTFQRHTSMLKSEREPSGYPENWKEISWAYRLYRKFTCEECGVRLDSHRGLVDVHHIDSDKQNNNYGNLRCLCKLCHSKEHRHYKISEHNRRIIMDARTKQRKTAGAFGDG